MEELKVYKFGGASVKDASSVRNVSQIVKKSGETRLIVVISAMGKVTNALETVVHALFDQGIEKALVKLDEVKSHHTNEVIELFENEQDILHTIIELFGRVEAYIKSSPQVNFNFDYDQIVSLGELLSSTIVNAYFISTGLQSKWLDARHLIKTDATYGEAKVLWDQTEKGICEYFVNAFDNAEVVVTQGFIASVQDGKTTTLGREGSDYTASIFSYCLNAESLSIWKDVPGIMTGDPKRFENLTKIDRLSYQEAVEMTYYGAKVIHPKTIKPLQNKGIPLYVKSFVEPESDGTLISSEVILTYPPVIVLEDNQALVHISTKDFSFVAEHHLSMIFDLFTKTRVKVNMMRNTAISFTICTHNDSTKLEKLVDVLEHDFKIVIDKGCELITVRHFNNEVVDELLRGKILLYQEILSNTVQMVVKDVPVVKRK